MSGMRQHRTKVQCLIAWGVVGALFGCSETDTTIPVLSNDGDPDRANLETFTESAVVGTEGAVIVAGDAEVVIPRGALAEPVEVVVETSETGFTEFPNADVEQVLAFMPHGTQFLSPVTIRVPHGYGAAQNLALYTSEPDQPWEGVPGATFSGEYANADVMHFSYFFASEVTLDNVVGGGGNAAGGNAGEGGSSTTPGTGGSSAGEGGSSAGEGGSSAGSSNVGGGSTGGYGGSSAGAGGSGAGAGNAGSPSVGGSSSGGYAGSSGGYAGSSAGTGNAGSPSVGGSSSGGYGGSSGGHAGAAGGPGGYGGSTAGGGGYYPDAGPGENVDYFDNGEWHGHLFAAADEASTVTRDGMCIEGQVGVNVAGSTFALWSWNLNQELDSEVAGTWNPTSEGIYYNTSSDPLIPLRMNVSDGNGHTWCLLLENEGRGFARFTDFNTQCWGGQGDFYDGSTPLRNIDVLVPGTAFPRSFDVCVDALFPFDGFQSGGSDAGSGAAGGGSGGGHAGFPDAGPGSNFDYLENQEWHGHLYSFADEASTVTRDGMCIEGDVGGDPGGASFALWGWNLNQEFDSVEAGTWDPTSDGLLYFIDAGPGVPLRMNISDATGEIWCLLLEDDSGYVSFTDFSTQCWSGQGDFYNGSTPLRNIDVLVPGGSQSQPYDLCVRDLFPVGGSPGGGGGSADAGNGSAGSGGGPGGGVSDAGPPG